MRLSTVERVSTPLPREPALSAGARRLLEDCVRGRSGERLLIVREPADGGYYEPDAAEATIRTACALGLSVHSVEAPIALADDAEIESFLDVLHGFDHVVFFARVGDQLRFRGSAALRSATMCYTLDRGMLDSAFGTACHAGLCEIKALAEAALANAREVRVSCPLGTDYRGHVSSPAGRAELGDTVLRRFPMLVPSPVPATGFAGRVVLSRFLVGTGSRFYEPYCLPLGSDVVAEVAGNRLVRFEGDPVEVRRVEAHYADIAGRYGIDPRHVHSWHAGIHPACTFGGDARRDALRWSGSAFGSPRLLHFHTCGDYAPGEISWNVLDPTVRVDGVALWERGVLHPERLPDGVPLLARHPELGEHYRHPRREIGVSG